MTIKKVVLLLVFVLAITSGYSQKIREIKIGILMDKEVAQTRVLVEKMKSEISSVIGERGVVVFKEILENNFDSDLARLNYERLLSGDTDLIISFGLYNNIELYKRGEYQKPTIVFGSINSDFIDLSQGKSSSNINNITYLIAPFSYKEDLEVFYEIYNYSKVGVIVDDFLPEILPIKKLLDAHFENLPQSYELITISSNGEVHSSLTDVDAVYVAGGFYLNIDRSKELIRQINKRRIPSFSAFGSSDLHQGVLATNQPESIGDQFARRLALSVEGIFEGRNAKDLPLFVDYKKRLTINYSTAKQIKFPLRYSLLSVADFIGDFSSSNSNNILTIQSIIDTVLMNNLGLLSKNKDVELSREQVKIAKSEFFPNLSLGVTGTYLDPSLAAISNGSNPELTTSGEVVLKQVLYSEQIMANLGVKRQLQKAEQENFNANQLDAVLNATTAYFNALILKANTNIQNQNLQITKRNLEIAEQNYSVGVSGKSDVLRFRSQLAQNTQNLVEAGNKLQQAFFTINQLMNVSIRNEIDVMEADFTKGVFENYKYEEFYQLLDNPKLQTTLVNFLIEEARKNSPELKSIGYNLKAVGTNYNLNDYGRFIPTVSLQGQYNLTFSRSGKGSQTPIGFPAVPNSNYNFGVNLSLPLFNQNKNNINKQIALVRKEQLGIETDNINLNIERKVNDVILELVNQITNIEISKVSEKTAKESLSLTQNAYKQGAVPVIQLIDAQANYLQAQLARSTAHYNYLITSMQLERIIGYFFLTHKVVDNQNFILRAKEFILKNAK